MDEKACVNDCPWPIEEILGDEFLSRHIPVQGSPKQPDGRRFPSESHFALKEGEDGLSHYWNRYITIEDIFITIGLSHRLDGQFKNHTAFKVFQIESGFIKSLNELITTEHKPIFRNPAPVGQPNNRSHSLVKFSLDETDLLQIRSNLAAYCVENYNISYRDFKPANLTARIEDLRLRGNKTPYHSIQ